MPVITLNSLKYSVEGNVDEENLVDPLSEAVRFTGTQQRPDNKKINTMIFDDWAAQGMFHRRMRQRTGRGAGGMWKSTAETRFEEVLYNALLEESQTHASPANHLVRYLNFKGDLIGLFEGDYASGSINTTVSRKFNASTDTWDDTASANDPTLNDTSTDNATGSSITVSHAAQSAEGNRIVVAIVANSHGAGASKPTGVTYGGTAMTEQDSSTVSTTSISMWYLGNPSTSTSSCVATFAETQDGGLGMAVSDYYNCDIVSPFASSETSAGSGTAESVSMTVEDDDLVIGGYIHVGTGSISVGSGQTEYDEFAEGSLDFSFSEERSSGTSTSFDHSYSTDGSSGAEKVIAGVLHAPNGIISIANANTTGLRIFDAVIHKGRIWAIGSAGYGNEQRVMVWASHDGAAWVQEDGTNWPTGDMFTTTVTRRNTFNDDMARLFDDGDTLYAVFYDETNKEIEIFTSTNNGGTWTSEMQIPSNDGPKGIVRWWNRQGASEVMLGTAEGVYALDITNNDFVREFSTDGQSANCRWMVVGDDGNLYVPLADDDIVKIELGSRVAEGVYLWNTERIGPMSGNDGMPSEWRGHANYMMSGNSVGGVASRWLWVLFGGHAGSKTATVLCYDYEASRKAEHPVWHCFHDAQESAVSGMGQNIDFTMMGVSPEDDATPRLHVTAEHASTSYMFHFEEPLVSHPTAGVSSKYQADNYVNIAENDHGDPHKAGAIYAASVSASELDTTANDQEKIVWKYGVEGGDWSDVTAGTFFSDALVITLASGAGVAMKESLHRLELTRGSGDTSERAILREFQVEWRKRYATLESHSVTIDLAKSAAIEQTVKNGDTETVITNLKTVKDSGINVAMAIGGGSTIYVEMSELRFRYRLVGPGDGLQAGKRTGTARCVLEEVR